MRLGREQTKKALGGMFDTKRPGGEAGLAQGAARGEDEDPEAVDVDVFERLRRGADIVPE